MSERRTHEAVITELVGAGLLQPRPRRTTALSVMLMLCVVLQVVGLGGQGIVTWSLTDMSSMPSEFRRWLVILSSFMLAVGSDVGTLPSTLEIFRKRRLGITQWPDWIGFAVGILASFVSTYNAQLYLAGFDVTQNKWRIVTLVSLTVLDMAFTLAESGDLRASYEMQVERWKEEYREAVDRFYAMENGVQPEAPEPPSNSAGPCWCGRHCESRHHYASHFRYAHIPEILEYADGVQARETMRAKYQETIPDAAWEFPTLEKFNRVKERDNGRT